jgi:hypothetical protein
VASTKPWQLRMEWDPPQKQKNELSCHAIPFLSRSSLFFSFSGKKKNKTQIFSLTLSLSTPLTQFLFQFLTNIITQIKLLITTNNYIKLLLLLETEIKIKITKKEKEKAYELKEAFKCFD